MKYLLTVLMVLAFITISCDKNVTESNNDGEIIEYSTVNVKSATEYFSFNTNSGSSVESADHDIVFYAVQWQPAPGAPVIYDPRFKAKDGMSIAVLKDTILEDVTDVPANGDFVANYTTETEPWYHMVNQTTVVANENVWVVNTVDGKFPAFIITNYYDEQGNSGVFNIEWKYLSE